MFGRHVFKRKEFEELYERVAEGKKVGTIISLIEHLNTGTDFLSCRVIGSMDFSLEFINDSI